MTSPADLRRLIRRINTSIHVAQGRLDGVITNLARHAADGHPTRASGNANHGGRTTAELTATEAAADTNLGDLYGYGDGTRDNTTDDDTHRSGYHPGPSIQLDDIATELRAALLSLDRAHDALTAAGVPPIVTEQYRCHGINSIGCPTHDWADPQRSDRLCINCARTLDSNARRLRKHRAS